MSSDQAPGARDGGAPGAPLADRDFLAMLNATDVCMMLHGGQDLKIVWANPAACRMLEMELEELLPLRANSISSSARQYDRVVARAYLQKALVDGESRVEWHLRSKSGRVHRTDAFAHRVELSGGPAVMVHYRDIEREQRTDTALRLAETSVDALTRHTSTLAFLLDRSGVILSATDTALGRLRLASGGADTLLLVGRPLSDHAGFRIGGTRTNDWERVRDAVTAEWPFQSITLEFNADTDRATYLEGSIERLPEQAAPTYLIIAHDVTERIRGEAIRELEQHQENYLARYTAMGDMAMAIAHELGQPLAAAGNFLAGVRARTAALTTHGDLPEQVGEQLSYGLDSVSRQVDRAAAIVSTLRSFVGHLEQVEQTVDLNDIVRECLPFIRLRADPTAVAVDLDLFPEPVPVRCERVLTGQVVLNLVFNAIDEMAESAPADDTRRILVSTRGVGATEDGEEGTFLVADRGRGLTRDPFSESFSGGASASGKAEGSGIGLALSYRIITRQRGRIWCEPRSGGGTVFGFALPASAEDPDPTAAGNAPAR